MFEPFVTHGKSHGTGLGMAIVKKIITSHEGEIWFDTDSEKGTEFFIKLPMIDNSASESLDTLEEPSQDNKNVTPLNILLVEDNPDNQVLFQFNLKKTPHYIDFADNGLIGVEKFKANSYDIVFMDKEMPVMNGFEAAQVIRKWETDNNKKHIPIVALTAHTGIDTKQQCMEIGCSGILTKPFKKEELLNVLNSYTLLV